MGPLAGLRIIEFAGLGPAPFACMLLADLGAEVIRIDRPGGSALGPSGDPGDVINRGRRTIALNLKQPQAIELALRLLDDADVLVEGFRPGVMEKLGLGPEVCTARNKALIYARMTGWGQEGPLAQAAGHDLNYIALSGALAAIGRSDSGPVPPLNLVGDFGGGSLYLALGICAALLERSRSGQGQVLDVAISDGVVSLMAPLFAFHGTGLWSGKRQDNMLDGGAPFYDTYECADGEWISIAAIETQFYQELADKLGEDLGAADLMQRLDRAEWPARKAQLASLFLQRTRAEWCELLEGSDVCFAPVLSMAEAPDHPHNRARGILVERDGVVQPRPTPNFSRSHCELPGAPPVPGSDTRKLLAELGCDSDKIERLLADGIAAVPSENTSKTV